MRRPTPVSLHDKHEQLDRLRQEAEAEFRELEREEGSLEEQVRQAKEQLRYYERLLVQLRRDWGNTPALAKIFRQLD